MDSELWRSLTSLECAAAGVVWQDRVTLPLRIVSTVTGKASGSAVSVAM